MYPNRFGDMPDRFPPLRVREGIQAIHSRPGTRMNPIKILTRHIRRITLIILDLLFDHDAVYAVLGLFNRWARMIEGVFLMYPASDRYALAYVYRSRLPKVRWDPFLAGLQFQNGRFTLQFAISAHNGQFNDPTNNEDLCRMVARMDRIRQLLGAKNKTFAGILPGILHRKGILKETPEADVTARVVTQAITQVIVDQELGANVPIIILGGNGYIGRRVTERLSTYQIYPIDIDDKWPSELKGKPALLVNIALKGVLERNLRKLWPGMVVINEVYPEPSKEAIERIREIGCDCYHVAGVKALAIPPFPHAYRGGIPCCAAWNAPKIRARVVKL